MCLLTDLHAFGCIDYYISLEQYNTLILEQYEHYSKGGYLNRYYVAGANGVLLLSIPLVHVHGKRTVLKDLRISNRDSWQKLHWKSLVSAYGRSPWFEYYQVDLEIMYRKKYDFIMDWNLKGFELVQRWLGKSWTVKMTDFFEKQPKNNQVQDGRHQFKPRRAGALDNRNTPYYPQVFEERNGFIPGLSILDLIFCEGRDAQNILTNGRKDREGS